MPWYPQMRHTLRVTASRLADMEYQQRAWVRGDVPPGSVDSFDLAVHFIYDDTSLAEGAVDCIGWYVRNAEEATLIDELVGALEVLFSVHGTTESDAHYLGSEEWAGVVASAKRLCEVLCQEEDESSC